MMMFHINDRPQLCCDRVCQLGEMPIQDTELNEKIIRLYELGL